MREERVVPSTRISRRDALAGLAALGAGLASARSHAESPADGLRAAAATALADLGRWADAERVTLGGIVLDARTGETLAARAEHRPLNPASNQKILTAAAALDLLGPEHCFVTSLGFARGSAPTRTLILRGEGDPELSVAELGSLIGDLRERDPAFAVDDILVDQSAFDSAWEPPHYATRPAEWAAYRAPVSAVAVERNAVTLRVLAGSGGRPARSWFEPPGLVRVTGRIETLPRGKPENVRLTLKPGGDRLDAELGGGVPESARELALSRRIAAPELAAGYVLRELLVRQGVRVSGGVRAGGAGQAFAEVATCRSRPLAQLVHALGKSSDNFAAEMLLKAISVRAGSSPGSSAGGARALESHLVRLSARDPGTRIENGSGLYDANRLSAWTLGRVLVAAYRDPRVGPELLSSLAIGGVDGTLRERFRGLARERSVRAKTGTLARVLTLSGYVLRASGPLAFSLLLNDVRTTLPDARKRLDEAVIRLAR